MGCQGIFRELKGKGYTASAALVFLFLKDEASCADDLRVACAPRYVAEELDFTEKVVRTALKQLAAGGLIKLETKARGYTMVSILWGAEKGAAKGAEQTPKKQPVFDDMGAEKGAAKGATGVTAVDVVVPAVGVAVIPVVGSDLNVKGRAQELARPAAAREAKRLDEMALAREPNLRDITNHVEALYGAMAGFKFPWQKGKDFVRLAEKCQQYTVPVVLAACDYFFHPANEWATKKGYRIDELMHQFSELLLRKGMKARAAMYASNSWGHMPSVNAADVASGAQQRAQQTDGVYDTKRIAGAQQRAQLAEVNEPDMTEAEKRTMHDQKKNNIGCRTKNCEYCPPAPQAAPPVAAMAGQSDVKRGNPF